MTAALWNLLRFIGPYVLVGGVAFGGGWRAATSALTPQINAARHALAAEKLAQAGAVLRHTEQTIARQTKTRNDYARARKQLAEAGEEMAAYQRCVDAGRCGPSVGLCRDAASASGEGADGLSATGRPDGTGPGAVPAARITAPSLIGDCAAVQLQLNQLQADIEAQPGYRTTP